MEEVYRSRKASIIGALPNGLVEGRFASARAFPLAARTAEEKRRSEETEHVRNPEAGIEFDSSPRSTRIFWIRKKEFRDSVNDDDGRQASRRPQRIQNGKCYSGCQIDCGCRKQSQPRTAQDAVESKRRHSNRSCRIDQEECPSAAETSGGFFRPVRILQRL